MFIDDDLDASTGYAIGGLGAGWLIENGHLFRHSAPGWSWTWVGPATWVRDGTMQSWSIARDALSAAGSLRLLVPRGVAAIPTPSRRHVYTR